MVISDLNIICLRQNEKQMFNNSKVGIDVLDLKNTEKSFYGDHWKLLTALQGIWYFIYPLDELKEYDYEHGFFNIEPSKKTKFKYYISLCNMNKELLSSLLDFYLSCSPIKQVCFLVRLDWNPENIICGTIRKKDFLRKLDQGKLLFNKAYILQE
ncbi:hypothetical protein KHQ81_01660 [Mycoplasmatota bacterium]|nr:hypothetical protein KHQ81_01660 [Mycoplasmatota bacterium]